MTWITFFGGWWGIVSFFVTPVYLVLNVANYLGASGDPKSAAKERLPTARTPPPLGWALSSLGVAILSFVLGIILGKWSFVGYLAAVLLGISALVKSRHAASATSTRVISMLGIGCGTLPLVAGVGFFLLFWIVGSLPQGTDSVTGSSQTPSSDAFDRANNRLFAFDGEQGQGNTQEAKATAIQFSDIMGVMGKIAFEGGRKNDAASLTKGHFLTHCEMREGKITFLVHVPELKNYSPEAKKALLDLAWTSAKVVTEEARAGRNVTLAVGLRGVLLYGASAIGWPPADPVVDLDGVNTDTLRPFFAGPDWPRVLQASTAPATATPAPIALADRGSAARSTPTAIPPAWVSPTAMPRYSPKAPAPIASPTLASAPRVMPMNERVKDFARLVEADREREALARLFEFKAEGREALPAVPVLVRIARDARVRESIKQEALRVLGDIGGREARETLLLSLISVRSSQRAAAADGFSQLHGEDAQAVVPRLAETLEKSCPITTDSLSYEMDLCSLGLQTLAVMGPEANAAVPSLVRLVGVQRWSSKLRPRAMQALGSFGARARDAVPALRLCLLNQGDDSVEAIRTLGRIGPAAIDALPDLTRLLDAIDMVPPASAGSQLKARREMISNVIALIRARPEAPSGPPR